MYIYKTTNLINGKIYIGQSTRNKADTLEYFGSGILIKYAIKKYGILNFSKEILYDDIDSKKELDHTEKWAIKIYNSQNKDIGYNIANGGEGRGSVTKETRQKISNASKGRIVSKKTRSKMSLAASGIKCSEVTKDKISHAIRGSKNANSKLTELEVILIKHLIFNTSLSMLEISKLYSISYSTIYKIKKGMAWSHIEIAYQPRNNK